MHTTLPTAILGRTGLKVTRLGFGCALWRPDRPHWTPKQAHTVWAAALDAGINFFDTAYDYVFSVAEERSHIRSCWFVFRHCWGSRFVIQSGLLLFHSDFMRMQPLNYSNWRIDIAWILLGHKCPYCGPCGVVRCYLWLIGLRH